ncbi:hypothetical protein VE03_05630 [Pseudogymnoascus sp. 23342-1-I1]|nr:hypothetical protein VE03_05630 [Pseudogymnoascus sp. 23342-1-I1]
MASSFPATDPSPRIGLYVGAIGLAFAAAQFMTSYFWGFLSDRTGRKPVILLCTFLTAVCFVAFGFCTKLWQAIFVQTLMGLLNGNQGIISPALGGLLVRSVSLTSGEPRYPYLLPNLASAAILMLDLILTAIFLEESLKEAKDLPPLKGRVVALFARRALLLSSPEIFAGNSEELSSKVVWNRNTLLLLGTYVVVQLSNISFNALYPIFAFAPAPLGRDIPARTIGISLSAVGIASILFQLCTFGRLKVKIGHKATYRTGLGLLSVALFAMPFVAYRDSPPFLGSWSGEVAMWIQITFILLMSRDGRRPHVRAFAYHEFVTVSGESRSAEWIGTDIGCGGTSGAAGSSWGVV